MKKKILSTVLATVALVPVANAVPKTLLDIAGGSSWPAARLSNSVLIIVDAQREYAEGKLILTGIDEAVASLSLLLVRARAAHTPVIHVVQRSPSARQIFVEGSPMAEVIPPLAPLSSEIIVPKQLPNSFAGTPLDGELRRLGRKDIIVVGFMTHMCVSATVRSALDHGYRCTVVASCCATRDLADGSGGLVSAADVHRVELAALRDRFATVVGSPSEIQD